MNINKAQICGRITRDPELKALPSGIKVINFSVATNYKYKEKETTEFHNVIFFGKIAEVIQKWFLKGDEILVEGRLDTRSWEKDGQKMYRTEIIGSDFQFGQKAKGNENRKPESQPAPPEEATIEYPVEEIDPNDIPF